MIRLNTIVILSLILFFACTHSPKSKTNHSEATGLTDWIESMRRLSHSSKDTVLIKTFFKSIIVRTDTPRYESVRVYDQQLCTAMFGDFDEESGEEMISMVGDNSYSPYLCVFKKYGNNWQRIYTEQIETFYSSPPLSVGATAAKSKVFWLRQVLDHGSGVYLDSYKFYKIIAGKVYKCLELVNDAHIQGWGLFLNQEISMKFDISTEGEDQIRVRYDYNFFPGAINRDDCSWCPHKEVSLIKGQDYVWYEWDNKKHEYKLEKLNYKSDPTDLTAEKIACFGDFGNDTLFVRAFKNQIDYQLKNGTNTQKNILKAYLKKVEKDKTARAGN